VCGCSDEGGREELVEFFDNISHDFLLQALDEVPGRELIRQWLKAGVLEEGAFHATETETPQGSVISPLLLSLMAVPPGLVTRFYPPWRRPALTYPLCHFC
jgi:hypothetical protein